MASALSAFSPSDAETAAAQAADGAGKRATSEPPPEPDIKLREFFATTPDQLLAELGDAYDKSDQKLTRDQFVWKRFADHVVSAFAPEQPPRKKQAVA